MEHGLEFVMSNDELSQAIQDTRDLVYKMARNTEIYEATCAHYKALLKLQEERAGAIKLWTT